MIKGGRKPDNQNSEIKSITNIYDELKEVINFYKDYSTMISDTVHDAKYGKKLTVLTPKPMFQILPIVLAQVTVGNTSKNLLNEICQIIYILYWAKKITKKVYNNIMNSIKV